MRRHPKMTTQVANIGSTLIAFNQEIGQALADLKSGAMFNDPEGTLQRVAYKASGVDVNSGGINTAQLQASAVSKIAGFAINKTAKWFIKRMRL